MRAKKTLLIPAFLVCALLFAFVGLSPLRQSRAPAAETPVPTVETPETPEPTPPPTETPTAAPAPTEAAQEPAPAVTPGPELQEDGRLRYIGEDGEPVRDAAVGALFFDAGGFYTSGDADLDRAVEEVLRAVREQQPDADRLALLRGAYDYMLSHYQYTGGRLYPAGSEGWEIEEAKDMLAKGLGNCFGYAGGFWALARGLGYEAVSRCRNLDRDYAHAWNDIEIDGVRCIFDPCLEQMKGNSRFMLSYEDGAKYGYPPV